MSFASFLFSFFSFYFGLCPSQILQRLPLILSLRAFFTFRIKECKKSSGSHGVCSGGETVVTYFFCGEEIPYRRTMKSHSLTLGHFKEQLRKKGNYRCVEWKPEYTKDFGGRLSVTFRSSSRLNLIK